MYEEYLAHYGVLGMRWGVRKDRSRNGLSWKQKRAAKKQAQIQKQIEQRRQRILSSPSKLYKHRNEFTQKDIDAAIKKFKWEAELRNLSNQQVSKGEQAINKIVKVESTASKLINTTKVLNKATGGFLFSFADKQMSESPIYSEIKKTIEEYLPKDKKKG